MGIGASCVVDDPVVGWETQCCHIPYCGMYISTCGRGVPYAAIFLTVVCISVSVCMSRVKSKREVPRGVRNSKVRRQDKFRAGIHKDSKYILKSKILLKLCNSYLTLVKIS